MQCERVPKKSRAVWPEQPFVTRGGQKIGVQCGDLDGHCAGALRGIEQQQRSGIVTRSRQGRRVQPRAVVESHQAR